jgi:acetate kinase
MPHNKDINTIKALNGKAINNNVSVPRVLNRATIFCLTPLEGVVDGSRDTKIDCAISFSNYKEMREMSK